MSFEFKPENLKKIEVAIAKYPSGRQASAVMELLYIAQEQEGWVSADAMKAIADILSITPVKVKEIATFYTMYYKEPVGKFVFQVCGTTPCMLRGSHELLSIILHELGIQLGETTKDGLFTVIEVECLGACANAPVVQINNHYYEDLNTDSIISIIKEIKLGNLPKHGSFKGRKSAEPLQFLKK